MTIAALHKFATKWGHGPDVAQLAKPTKMVNLKGYMSVPEKLTAVGDRVEADFPKLNYQRVDTKTQ